MCKAGPVDDAQVETSDAIAFACSEFLTAVLLVYLDLDLDLYASLPYLYRAMCQRAGQLTLKSTRNSLYKLKLTIPGS